MASSTILASFYSISKDPALPSAFKSFLKQFFLHSGRFLQVSPAQIDQGQPSAVSQGSGTGQEAACLKHSQLG